MVNQLAQRALHIGITVYVSLHSINYAIVCNTALNIVKTFPWLFANPTVNYEVEPLLVVSVKTLCFAVLWLREFISVYYCLFCSSNSLNADSPLGSLLKQRRKIKAWTEIQVFSTYVYQRLLNDDV